MSEFERNECMAALRTHEREVERLSRTLAHLGANDDGWNDRVRLEIELTTARVTKHRISMELISSRLAAGS